MENIRKNPNPLNSPRNNMLNRSHGNANVNTLQQTENGNGYYNKFVGMIV